MNPWHESFTVIFWPFYALGYSIYLLLQLRRK